MTNDAEARRIEDERGRLEARLWKLGYETGMPDAASVARHNALIAELQAQLAALPRPPPPPRPPPGRRIVFDGRISADAFERPDPASEHVSGTGYNPFDDSPTSSKNR